jgi:hypothetical protein
LRERHRPTEIETFVQRHGTGDCSLLVRLFKLDQELRRTKSNAVIGLGLEDPPEHYGHPFTPKNSITFATTGGDDVHFSLVSRRGKVSDLSPVVVTIPAAEEAAEEASFLVGNNLYEFLCLGLRAGFDPLEDLTYAWEETVQELETGPEPGEFDADDLKTLKLLKDELNLKPWEDIDGRLRELQQGRRSILRFRKKWWPW